MTEVMLETTADQVQTLTTLLGPALGQARLRAQRAQSASNIRQILMTCFLYADDNKGMFPESLDALVQRGLIKPENLINPEDPQHRRYVYRRPADLNKVMDATLPVLWEEMDEKSEGANIGFADGHVEYRRGREQIQAEIHATEPEKLKEPGRSDRP